MTPVVDNQFMGMFCIRYFLAIFMPDFAGNWINCELSTQALRTTLLYPHEMIFH